MRKDIELLAPVGSMESLYAAVQNGANAVYLGGKLFSARAYASNFDSDELMEAVSYAHLRGVKVYVTANILVDDGEMKGVLDYIKYLYEIDVDAIIVQDLGLAKMIRDMFPKLDIHGSTQMTINNLAGAKFLNDMGFTRVVLARETPIDEIKLIHKNTSIELEAFVHGALCMSYSGQCLMSSLIGGRSGNRGTCAQPCRMPYSIVDGEGNLLKDWDKQHVLSTKDLNTLENIEELVDSGIISLKIEGRMKRPEYVATVVNSYKKALDFTNKPLTDEDKSDVEQIFNRGFTKGHTFGDFGRDFISNERPDNRGTLLGKVIRADKYKVYVLLEQDIDQGDGMEFMLSNGEYKGIKATVDGKKGTTLHMERPGHILVDSNVYKTSSSKLLIKAKESYVDKDIKYPIDMEISIAIGEKPKLIIMHKNHVVEITGENEVEASQKVAITKEKVIEQLSKLGDTNFVINNLNINLEEGAFLPVSLLNQLRRDATLELNGKVSDYNKREIINQEEFKTRKDEYFKFNNRRAKESKRLSIKVSSMDQFNQLNLEKLDRVYLDFLNDTEQAVNRVKEKGKEVYLSTEKILYEKDLKHISNILKPVKNLIDGVSASNIGSIRYFKDNFDLKIHGDIGLNIFNSYTLRYLKEIGLDSMTLSPELNLTQIRKIADNISGNLEGIVYGFLPAMITKNCPMSLVKGCKDDSSCKTCNFAKDYGLKDRMGITFKLERKEGFSVVYNSVPVMVLDSLDQIFNSGISLARLDFTSEIKTIASLQNVYYEYINGNVDSKYVKEFVDDFRFDNKITNGHYFRGIV